MITCPILLLNLLLLGSFLSCSAMFKGQDIPPGCDESAAQRCEDDLLLCQLFSGPADDPATMCACGSNYYGKCLREAGCETANEVGALTKHEVYMKTCVDFIIKFDCPDVTMCSINCASEDVIDLTTAQIMPFNNYGEYYLRVKICIRTVQPEKLSRYRIVDPGNCNALADYQLCTRWIPPLTFVPVALPRSTFFIEIDSCRVPTSNGTETVADPYCLTSNPSPRRVFGNQVIWPSSFEVAKTAVSICAVDGDCLGSYCDFTFNPPVCSPKSSRHLELTGRNYLSDPFSEAPIN